MKGVMPRKRHPIMFYSTTFSPTEQNYNTHNLEFLGVIKSIEHWRPYLIWTKEPFIIEMDHKNLTYWKAPRKLTGRTACLSPLLDGSPLSRTVTCSGHKLCHV